jgi:hypothetical protein
MTDKNKPRIETVNLVPDEPIVDFVGNAKRKLGTWSLAYEVCGWNGETFRTDVIPLDAINAADAQREAKALWPSCCKPHGTLERSRENARVRFEEPLE